MKLGKPNKANSAPCCSPIISSQKHCVAEGHPLYGIESAVWPDLYLEEWDG